MIALFKALIWHNNSVIDNYEKSQKPKGCIFCKLLPQLKKTPVLKKITIGALIRIHFLYLSIKSLE